MEKLKTIRYIIFIAGALFFIQLVMMAIALRPLTTFMWLSFAILALLGFYFIRVSLALARELKDRIEGKPGWDD